MIHDEINCMKKGREQSRRNERDDFGIYYLLFFYFFMKYFWDFLINFVLGFKLTY